MSALMVAFALTVAPGTGAAACPPPVRETPRYPARQLIGGVSGTTLVLARIDGCGRVLEVKVSQGSGVEALDAEALPTVRGWVLSPAQREPVGGGPWVQMPVQLGGQRNVVTVAPKWPRGQPRASLSQSVAITRYRLVVEDGKPAVRVGTLCERSADECERLREFPLNGLPIAKPPR